MLLSAAYGALAMLLSAAYGALAMLLSLIQNLKCVFPNKMHWETNV
jgi:hypothetical protein